MKRADYITRLSQVTSVAELDAAVADDWSFKPVKIKTDEDAVAAARQRRAEVNAPGFVFKVKPKA